MSDLIDLLDTDFFQVGLRFGLAALVLGWIAVVIGQRTRRPVPVAGVLITFATFTALVALGEEVTPDLVGLGLMVVGVVLARLLRATDWLVALAAVPGALWIAIGTSSTNLLWVRIAIVVVVPVAGFLTSDFEKRYEGIGLGVVFYTLAALGVFVAVPDTEWARTLVAVAVPIAFLSWPKAAASLGAEGSYLAVTTLILVAAHGGEGRPASIVGGVACLGLLVLEPIAMAMASEVVKLSSLFRRNWAGVVLAALPQFVIVALCSRVAARFTRELPALIAVVVVYVVALVVGVSAVSDGARGAAD